MTLSLESDPQQLGQLLKAELALLGMQAPKQEVYMPKFLQITLHALKANGGGVVAFLGDGGQLGYPLCTDLEVLKDAEGQFLPMVNQGIQLVFSKDPIVWMDEGLPHEHLWVAVKVLGKVKYALHVWFLKSDARVRADCECILKSAAEALELFFVGPSLDQSGKLMPQTIAQTHLLEELVGEHELEPLGWRLVNYTREALNCQRVSLLTVDGYTQSLKWAKTVPFHKRHFTLKASSGLKKVNKRAEQSVLLKGLAEGLLQLAYQGVLEDQPDVAPGQPGYVGMAMAKRHPVPEGRPASIKAYFAKVPMNWAAVVPLIDGRGTIAGLLVCEGQSIDEQLQATIQQLPRLAQTAGKALGNALQWDADWALQATSRLHKFLEKATPSWRKTMARKWAIGLSVFAGILLCPFPYKVKGSAILHPLQSYPLTAHRTARLIAKPVPVGAEVEEGQVLAVFDAEDLEKALAQSQQRVYQAQASVGRSGLIGREVDQTKARIEAQGAQAASDQLHSMLERSILKSPCKGVLIGPNDLKVQVGSVLPEGTVVAEVMDPTQWLVHINVREQDLMRLEERLASHGPCSGSLMLFASPTESYELWLTDKSQLFYGTNPFQDAYNFTVALPLKMDFQSGEALRPGFVGDASISLGWQTLAALFFYDFLVFCKVRS